MIDGRRDRDRAVSITVTHVLTIGITTILIAGLLVSASTMLETEANHSAETALETIGERLANEIGNVDRIADENTTVTATVDHPRRAGGSRYTVSFPSSCGPLIDESNTDCLKLTAHSADAVVYVPIKTNAEIDLTSEATGGAIKIRYDDTGSNGSISITEAER